MKRLISHSEIERAMTCQAQHAFAYTGALSDGSALSTMRPHVRLREGRAWGRAVAVLHETGDGALAHHAIGVSLEHDADQLREGGFHNEVEHDEMHCHLDSVLAHYAATSEPLTITDPEFELRVPLPSRKGSRASTRYVFHGFLDGLTEHYGRLYIVEYKLRKRLSSLADIALQRQYRRYAWAAERALGREIAGVIVDERLNAAPKPARMLLSGKPSHVKDQLTTPTRYAQACVDAGVEMEPETYLALEQRRWQVRHTLTFRRSEIAEAGDELVSAAKLIGQLDSGELFPVRNPSPMRCPGCAFREICADPSDGELIDLTFNRVAPKRDREEAAMSGWHHTPARAA